MYTQFIWFARKWVRWLRIGRKRHWFYFVWQIATLAALLYWITDEHLPWPGVAVAILAVLAALMSVQSGIRPLHKLFYFGLMAALLITEFRAIRKDREEARQAQDQVNKNANTRLENLLDGERQTRRSFLIKKIRIFPRILNKIKSSSQRRYPRLSPPTNRTKGDSRLLHKSKKA